MDTRDLHITHDHSACAHQVDPAMIALCEKMHASEARQRRERAQAAGAKLIAEFGVIGALVGFADALKAHGPMFVQAAEDVEAVTGHAPAGDPLWSSTRQP
jgi:hypothetical protein